MLVVFREIHNQSYLGFGNIARIHATHSNSFLVYVQHDLHGLFPLFSEESLQDYDDEFHRRKIIV